MSRLRRSGIGARIALASLLIALVTVGIVAVGVIGFGGAAFTDLMTAHGESAEAAREMFEASVLAVLVGAVVVAAVMAALLAAAAGRWLSHPLRDVSAAARRIAEGDYGARIERPGTEELASLVDSFNQMGASLQEQERMRREFVANAAHELRTPLTNLKGYLEGLRDGVIGADRRTFESLWEETERLVRLSHSLDRLEEDPVAPARSDVAMDHAVATAVALGSAAGAEKDLAWEVDVPEDMVVRTNADQLAQVLANLIQNAVRYTPPGGTDATGAPGTPGGTIAVRAEERPSDVLVSVLNTGATIDAGELPKVFERFYRVDRSRDRRSGGAGIGLAIVKQLVETAGGRVGAESRDGRTTFWFSLPRA